MADVKISELNELGSASVAVSNDVLPIVDASVPQTKKISVENLVAPITLDKSNSRVGIGVTSPSEIFHVQGTGVTDRFARFESTNYDMFLYIDADSGASNADADTGIIFRNNNSEDFRIGVDETDSSFHVATGSFGSAGTKKLTIDSSGNSTFEGTIISSTSSTTDSVLTLEDAGVAAYNWTFPDTSTIKMSTNTSSSKVFELKNEGSGLFNLKVEGEIEIQASSDPAIKFNSSEAGADAWYLYSSGSGLKFRNLDDSVTAFELTHSNNAVFSGTITATGENHYFKNTGGNANVYIQASNSGNSRLYFGDVADVGAGFLDYDHGTDMRFGVEGSPRMTINSSGSVGIGLTNPSYKFQVADSDNNGSVAFMQDNYDGTVGGTMDIILGFKKNDGNFRNAAIIRAAKDDIYTTNTQADGRLEFFTTLDGTSNKRMQIASGGQLFLFNQTSGAGNATLKYTTGTGAVTYDTSSRLVKDNIEDSPYGLDEILQLQSRKYFRTDDQRNEIGLIADEVIGILPEFVPTDKKSCITGNEEDDEIIPIGVNYDKIVSVLVKAVQELSAKVEALENA